MASLKEVRGRIVSVNSTQQITKAMKMVAAAKLRKSQDNIIKLRPYVQKLNGILANVSATLDGDVENPYGAERKAEKILIVLITSDRGLAGAFNSNVIKASQNLLNTKYSAQLAQGNVHFLCIGKKGLDFYNKKGLKTIGNFVGLFKSLSFDQVRPAAEYVMNAFVNKEYDKVEIIYNEFKNVATQIVRVKQYLPITKDDLPKAKAAEVKVEPSRYKTNYIFEPSQKDIVADLIPKSLKIQFYEGVLESNASEHGARMTAMDKATDNAKELLKELRLTYNRTRQAAITKEILEIVGGAEALNG
ncbi:MAG: ATP synthase F1 subunit gamma [Cytophagaceae bacterium]|nr:ATP synthase F1 subunit gamma [Cytophagaceae bacterium]